MNKNGQSAIYIIIIMLLIGIVWIAGLSQWVGETGTSSVQENNLDGLDGFFYSNLNLWFGLAWIIALFIVLRAAT